jgi:hypothetical protein
LAIIGRAVRVLILILSWFFIDVLALFIVSIDIVCIPHLLGFVVGASIFLSYNKFRAVKARSLWG